MTDDERAHIFHPFRSYFDRGTGIGMAIVFRIVDEHRGRIQIASEKGKGTSIVIALPFDDPRPAEQAGESA